MDDDSNPKPDRPGDPWIAEYEAASASEREREREPPAPQPEPAPTSRVDAFRYLRLPRELCLKGPANPVFRVLCDHADYRSGRSYLYMETIANEAGVSRSTAKRAIRRLEEIGLVVVRAGTRRKTQEQGANVYRIIPGGHSEPPGGSERTAAGGHSEPQ